MLIISVLSKLAKNSYVKIRNKQYGHSGQHDDSAVLSHTYTHIQERGKVYQPYNNGVHFVNVFIYLFMIILTNI